MEDASAETNPRSLDDSGTPAAAAGEPRRQGRQTNQDRKKDGILKTKGKSSLPIRRGQAADSEEISDNGPSQTDRPAAAVQGQPQGFEPTNVVKQEVGQSLEDERQEAAIPQRESPVPRVFRQNRDTSGIRISLVATRIYTIGYLVLFSILGVLARLGLQALTYYPNAPVQQGLVWANFAGSFVMGFMAEDSKLFRHEWGGKPVSHLKSDADDTGSPDPVAEKKRHGVVKKTIPLFVGMATGFCGSCTSFSSFQRDTFLIMANSAPSPETSHVLVRNGGYSFLGVLASLIVTPVLSLAALQAGAHLALAAERFIPSLNFYFVRGFLDPVASFIGIGIWLGAVFMAIWPPDRPHGPSAYYHETWDHETWRGEAIFACVFAPVGTLIRFYVSMWLNPRIASFPCGTFAVNIGGTLLEGLFYDLQHAKIPAALMRVGGGRVGCQVLQGLQDGLCGCLTTVSTWVAELKGLRRSHGYVYGLVSLAIGVGVMVIIMGSVRWTHGFYAPQCVT